MPQEHGKHEQAVSPDAPPTSPQRSPYGSREGQIERRHPGKDDPPPLEERRKTDEVGGED